MPPPCGATRVPGDRDPQGRMGLPGAPMAHARGRGARHLPPLPGADGQVLRSVQYRAITEDTLPRNEPSACLGTGFSCSHPAQDRQGGIPPCLHN